MADEQIKVEDDIQLEAEEETTPDVEEPVEVEEPPAEEEPEVEEPAEEEPEKEKKPHPARGRGRQEKGKGEEKGFTKGQAWWKENGFKLQRKGHSQRNIILKAAREAGVTFDRAMKAMRGPGTVEEKATSLFD